MNFRVTSSTFFSQAIVNSQARTADIANLQLQLSTGLRLHKPSDSPAEMRDLLIEKLDDIRKLMEEEAKLK